MRLHLTENGEWRGERRQTWKSFLKATTETRQERDSKLTFLGHFLSHPSNLGREVTAYKTAQRLGAGHSAGLLLKAREMQWPDTCSKPPLMRLPTSDSRLTETRPALSMPPSLTEMPPLYLTIRYLGDQGPLFYSLVQVLLEHKKIHHPQRLRK